ncbi:MAG: BON domain-containing protein [Chloroflexota bacterium]|nr:BON domain-containing protein [Chloroflexota bacterium]
MTITQTRTKTDKQIQLDVLADIARDFYFKPAEIGVEVDDGIVTLTGTVSSYLKVGEAADIASVVPGVKDVANKLTVALVGAPRDDTAIARAVRNALEWHVTVPEEKIESIVRNGIVTLKGTVDDWYQRKAAAEAVAHLVGVVSVNNHLVIAPPLRTDTEIHDELKPALMRRFPFEDIDVAVDKGVVILQGSVPSYRIRREAETITWATRGVKDLTNKLTVID